MLAQILLFVKLKGFMKVMALKCGHYMGSRNSNQSNSEKHNAVKEQCTITVL
jgi:hypothetical protein